MITPALTLATGIPNLPIGPHAALRNARAYTRPPGRGAESGSQQQEMARREAAIQQAAAPPAMPVPLPRERERAQMREQAREQARAQAVVRIARESGMDPIECARAMRVSDREMRIVAQSALRQARPRMRGEWVQGAQQGVFQTGPSGDPMRTWSPFEGIGGQMGGFGYSGILGGFFGSD